MKRINVSLTFLALTIALISPLTQAEDTGANEPEIYSIELVMFQRFTGGEDEVWPVDPGQPDHTLAVRTLLGETPITANDETNLSPRSQEKEPVADFKLTENEALLLGPVSYTLRRKGYLVVLHLGWRQPLKGWKENDWSWIANDRVHGLVRVTRGRYLHLDVDLLVSDVENGQLYRVQASRRMRSDELHYIDHPIMGIIARADRWVPPEQTADLQPGPVEESPVER